MTVSTYEACIAYGTLMIGIASMFAVAWFGIREILDNATDEEE